MYYKIYRANIPNIGTDKQYKSIALHTGRTLSCAQRVTIEQFERVIQIFCIIGRAQVDIAKLYTKQFPKKIQY